MKRPNKFLFNLMKKKEVKVGIGAGIVKARDGKTKSFIKGKYNGTELYIGLPVEMQKKYKYIFDGVENGKNNYN